MFFLGLIAGAIAFFIWLRWQGTPTAITLPGAPSTI
jgi:hypothetical protein